MSEPKVLLWVDVESTGLLQAKHTPTILELSWMTSDAAGRQLTPLEQRYSAIQTDGDMTHRESRIHIPAHRGPDDHTIMWTHEDARTDRPDEMDDGYPDEAVREMHTRNGLAAEVAALVSREDRERSPDDPHHGVLTTWEQVHQLIGADLDRAGWGELAERECVLAGGGVSHYEHRFLPDRLPTYFLDQRMHYAVVDVSTVLRTAHVRMPNLPRRADGVLKWANSTPAIGNAWRKLDVSANFAAPGADPLAWSQADEDDHRAASGVARALMAYRLIPDLLLHQAGGMADAIYEPGRP